MKCVKSIRATKDVELGEIRRVDEKTAYNMVGNSWQYVSKTEWKLSRGNKVVEESLSEQPTEQVEKTPYKKGTSPYKKNKQKK